MHRTLEPEEGDEVVYGPSGPIWLDKDGILIVVDDGKTVHDLEKARETMEIANRLRRGNKSVVFIDFTNIKSVDREVREFYTSEEVISKAIAVAIISNSIVGRMIGNFFLGIQHITVPIKLFGDKGEARQWLRSYI